MLPQTKIAMITAFYEFMDTWNDVLGLTTPEHHRKIMEFLVSVLTTPPHRGLLQAFRHSGKSTVVGIFVACVLRLHPETRILVLSAESNLASRMVAHVRHILENHPHMVLRPECFAAIRINWKPKNENLLEIAEELNLGTDSFVFWDDSIQERQLIKETIPQAAVPDFPENPELLAEAMGDIYRKYFDKPVLTGEDLQKTRQYAQNAKRSLHVLSSDCIQHEACLLYGNSGI